MAFSPFSPEEIKKNFDEAIIDYVEKKETIKKLVERIKPYDTDDVFFDLNSSPYGDLIGLIDEIGYIFDDPEYNTASPGYKKEYREGINGLIQDYYNTIKPKKG